MIRIVAFFLVFNFLSSTLFSQKKDTNTTVQQSEEKLFAEKTLQLNKNVLSIAIEAGDSTLREIALANILALNLNDTSALYALLGFYFETGNFLKAFNLSKKYLPDYGSSITLLNFYAKSAQMVGRYGDAYTGFDKLFMLTSNTYYGFWAANAQFVSGRYKDCLSAIDELIHNEDAEIRSVDIDAPNGKPQSVVVLAAAYYLKGVVLKALNKPQQAQDAFLSATKTQPGFNNALKELDQK